MVIERDVVCPYCAYEFTFLSFTEYTRCEFCNMHFHIDDAPVSVEEVRYEGGITEHEVETFHPRTRVPAGKIKYFLPPSFIANHNQWLNYEISGRCLREICPSCIHHPECSLSKGIRIAMGENFPAFPAEWLVISQDYMIPYEYRDNNSYVVCHRYDDGQTELFEGLFPKVSYLPQAYQTRHVYVYDGSDRGWDIHTLRGLE